MKDENSRSAEKGPNEGAVKIGYAFEMSWPENMKCLELCKETNFYHLKDPNNTNTSCNSEVRTTEQFTVNT